MNARLLLLEQHQMRLSSGNDLSPVWRK